MKRVKFLPVALSIFLLSGAFFPPDNNTINVTSKKANLPNWQWSSGEVKKGENAEKECFTIIFDKKVYHPNDSINITFNSYKVALTNLTKGTTFDKWSGTINLVCHMNTNWSPLVKNANARINQPFSGVNNNPVDSLTNYVIKTTVPSNRVLILTVGVAGWKFNDIQGPNAPMFAGGKGYPTFTTSIKGIEVEKITVK